MGRYPYDIWCCRSEFISVDLYVCVVFQKHENEEDEANGDKDGGRREKKDSDVPVSFVFGQNIKDRAKVILLYFAKSMHSCKND